jgi:hypothetical protein
MDRADGCDVLGRTDKDAAEQAESEGRRRNLEACRIFDACDSGLQFTQEAEVSGSVFLGHGDDADAHSFAWCDVTDNRAGAYTVSRNVDEELDHCAGLGRFFRTNEQATQTQCLHTRDES